MPRPCEKVFANITVGDTAQFATHISLSMVDAFASLSGDTNPLHTDDTYAANTSFKKRLPHGMIAGALFSRLVGMELPGLYALYMNQSLSFHHPLPVDTPITVIGEVIQKVNFSHVIKIKTTIVDTDNLVLVSGEALVRVLK